MLLCSYYEREYGEGGTLPACMTVVYDGGQTLVIMLWPRTPFLPYAFSLLKIGCPRPQWLTQGLYGSSSGCQEAL